MYIKYFASNSSMGDTTDFECEKYREWAALKLKEEFPNHDIIVSADECLHSVETNDAAIDDEATDFCNGLWDGCCWEWLE